MPGFEEQKEYCLNCKSTLRGEYCHYCGQKKIDTHEGSIVKMMSHFIGDFVHFDSAIFRTAIPLLVKPGFLVNEYLKGKRARYLSPFKMYVFLSFLFFFLTFSLTDFTQKSNQKASDGSLLKFNIKDDSTGKTRDMSWTELSDTLVKIDEGDFTFSNEGYTSTRQYDSIQSRLSVDQKDGWLKYHIKMKALVLKEKFTGQERGDFFSEMVTSFLHNFPKVFFFLLPVFALLLKMLYHKRHYTEHLIFSIQFYNFFYLFGIGMILFGFIPFLKNIPVIFYFLLPLFYLLMSMKNVYNQSIKLTTVKFFTFIFIFNLFIVLGLAVNVILTVLSV